MNQNEKQCYFCTNNVKVIDYKNVELLRQFINPQSRVLPRRRTGVCASCQRKLARTIKQARFLALLPFTTR